MQISTNLSPEYRTWFEAIYPRLATKYNLPLIPFFLENVAAVSELNLPDGIHPTAEWYGIIAQQTKEFLEQNQLISK
jgi:acyl-CoA thioesterase-1